MADSFYIPPGSVAEPKSDKPSIGAVTPGAAVAGEKIDWLADGSIKPPQVNLLIPPEQPAPAAAPAKPRHRLVPLVAAGGVLLVAGGAYGYFMLMQKPSEGPVVQITPSPTPAATPTPSPTPSATLTPSPSTTPAPETVTAPVETPTAEKPQVVTITSKSGLWLRSSPTSISRDNIIGWMPNGSQVSVDAVGDFWWHGTYKGEAGYFASKYTQ